MGSLEFSNIDAFNTNSEIRFIKYKKNPTYKSSLKNNFTIPV